MKLIEVLGAVLAAALIAGCEGSSHSNHRTIGGTVTGLEGTGLVIQNNGGDDLTVNADGTFTFATSVGDGENYKVANSEVTSGSRWALRV